MERAGLTTNLEIDPGPPSVDRPRPRRLFKIVLLGANDAAVTMPVDNQHVDLDRFRANLKAIVTHPRVAAHAPTILLVTPPPLDEIRCTEVDLSRGQARGSREAKISASYSQAVRELAAELPGVLLVDLWRGIMDLAVAKTPGFEPGGAGQGPFLGDPECGRRGYLEKLLPDGLHMSGEAYRVFFDLVAPHIPKGGEESWVFPEWRKAPWLDN